MPRKHARHSPRHGTDKASKRPTASPSAQRRSREQPAPPTAVVMAGIPEKNLALFHRLRFSVGDPCAIIELPGKDGATESVLIVRDIEMARARQHARVDRVHCPADFAPDEGLSGDRETATAQAVAQCLRRAKVRRVIGDRSLPLIFTHEIAKVAISVAYDDELGVLVRRQKDAQEIEALRLAQRVTEDAMGMACEMVAHAAARDDGILTHGGETLSSERVRAAIDIFLLQRGYTNPGAIVAGGPVGADCHDHGHGELRTGQPVIIDIFPCSRATRYHGDCTRTVVHGAISAELRRMHAAVVNAKRAAIAAIRPGVTGDAVHQATVRAIEEHGFAVHLGQPPAGAPDSWCGLTHGTGHGIGLDVHEPPLLAPKGPALLMGDALTVEPGLYSRAIGGIRVEDMVIVTADGCVNLNALPEGLSWR